MQAAKLLPVLGLLALGACSEQIEASRQSVGACRSPLKPAIEVDLYFGRDIDGRAEVAKPTGPGSWLTKSRRAFPMA